MPAAQETTDGSNQPLNKDAEQQEEIQELPENITGQTKVTLRGEEVWGSELDLDENAYGCAAVALVRESTKLSRELRDNLPKSLTLVRLCSSLGLMAINLLLQFMILNYISHYVVEPQVKSVQLIYSQYHALVFDKDGHIKDDVWEDFPMKDDVCSITMADSIFYYLILLLWTLRILDELRKIHRFGDEVCAIKGVSTFEEQLEFTDTNNPELGGRCLITGLTAFMRFLLFFVVLLPRLAIALYLLCLGCRWLSASANFADMVLNALALVFVTDIDELLYESVLPSALKKQIADTNWFFIEQPKTKPEVDATEWKLYRRTVAWLTAVVVFLGVYGMVAQTVLPFGVPDVAQHCQEMKKMRETPYCDLMSWAGEKVLKDCYPFGDNAEIEEL